VVPAPPEDPPAPLPPDGDEEAPAPEQAERRKASVSATAQMERIRAWDEVVDRKTLAG